MSGTLQNGIYYDKEIGKSLCIVYLKAGTNSDSSELAYMISELKAMYDNLEKGIPLDLEFNGRMLHPDNLTVLFAYGPDLFKGAGIRGLQKNCPLPLQSSLPLSSERMGSTQADDPSDDNQAAHEHILIQFIADTQSATHLAVVETRKLLDRLNRDKRDTSLRFSSFYTGFNRSDRRGWLGFHEGVSNMNREQRLNAIVITRDSISNSSDIWTLNGTYLCFIRIYVDLVLWDNINRKTQEILVGRDKLTGCPLVNIDNIGNPVKDPRCPVSGTSEVIEAGNEHFREHPDYSRLNLNQRTRTVLENSHVGRTRKYSSIPEGLVLSNRIYRQGFEFLESLPHYPHMKTGLNFISFQNSPERLFNIFTDSSWLGGSKFGGVRESLIGDKLISIHFAGCYYVPPNTKTERFPGECIFVP